MVHFALDFSDVAEFGNLLKTSCYIPSHAPRLSVSHDLSGCPSSPADIPSRLLEHTNHTLHCWNTLSTHAADQELIRIRPHHSDMD
ncbi:hypothetical protein CRE_20606 [Caenorhabditis remanei]|uniref:Uncharacterized protein n=1 Tax=Caenorhabditis remanei TaxID=31234 RepID=E3NKV3_CAERE|nr:hypothetical protein CRE_20606 [Caenorhabditis remanei]